MSERKKKEEWGGKKRRDYKKTLMNKANLVAWLKF